MSSTCWDWATFLNQCSCYVLSAVILPGQSSQLPAKRGRVFFWLHIIPSWRSWLHDSIAEVATAWHHRSDSLAVWSSVMHDTCCRKRGLAGCTHANLNALLEPFQRLVLHSHRSWGLFGPRSIEAGMGHYSFCWHKTSNVIARGPRLLAGLGSTRRPLILWHDETWCYIVRMGCQLDMSAWNKQADLMVGGGVVAATCPVTTDAY